VKPLLLMARISLMDLPRNLESWDMPRAAWCVPWTNLPVDKLCWVQLAPQDLVTGQSASQTHGSTARCEPRRALRTQSSRWKTPAWRRCEGGGWRRPSSSPGRGCRRPSCNGRLRAVRLVNATAPSPVVRVTSTSCFVFPILCYIFLLFCCVLPRLCVPLFPGAVSQFPGVRCWSECASSC
jgi:hypothetical protein